MTSTKNSERDISNKNNKVVEKFSFLEDKKDNEGNYHG